MRVVVAGSGSAGRLEGGCAVELKVTRGVDPPEVEGYQWDGWKLIMIAKLNTNGTFHSRKWSCVWRPDVGSSLYARSDWMRAGGVGGVAWLQTGAAQSYSYGTGSGEVHVPLADHMGNVRHYYQFKASGSKVTGQLVASYEYDAFGREVRAWGLNTPATNQPPGLPASRPWADHLPFHYSSKLRDVDSGFNYYGYRFYDPGAGRWLNRDPIGERGGLNLYGMVGNNPVSRVDVLGLLFDEIDVSRAEREAKAAAEAQAAARRAARASKTSCENFADALVAAAEGGCKCKDYGLALMLHFGTIVKNMGSYARGRAGGTRGLPVDGFRDDLVNNTQGGQVYQHILGHAAGVLGGEANDPIVAEGARRYAQINQERDQRQHDNPNDPKDPHDPAEAETELRDDKAGEAVGRAISDFCKKSISRADLKKRLMKTLCDH